MTATASSLQEEYAPLTGAEASVVLARLDDDPDRGVADVVADVKAERAGPATMWEDVPEIASPVVEEVEAVQVELDRVSQKRISAAGNDSGRELEVAARLKRNLAEINAYLIGAAAEQSAEENPRSAVDVEADTAADVVAHLRDHPGDVDAVEEAELARPGGARKTVLDAVDKARKSEGGES